MAENKLEQYQFCLKASTFPLLLKKKKAKQNKTTQSKQPQEKKTEEGQVWHQFLPLTGECEFQDPGLLTTGLLSNVWLEEHPRSETEMTEKLYYQRNEGKINKEQYRNIQDYSISLVNTGRIY